MDLQLDMFKFLKSSHHYYGDFIRKMFLLSGIIMLFLLPFFISYIPIPLYVALFIILMLSIIAGLINPLQKWIALLDTVISVVGVIAFGYYSIESYKRYSIHNLYFWINEVLAILFLIALYFSVKTCRGFFIKGGETV